MRKRINRPEQAAALAEMLEKSRARVANTELRKGRQGQDVIRNGVKTERDTQPVQVRMLKAQIKVLKQIASQEDRTASDIIRELVDQYIEHCLKSWPDGDALSILQSTIRQTGYWEEFERTPAT
ncbi:hypothetical protein [Paraburkholderia humisilvae]|uniref:Ribbon-helix-helix protein CopG domain-containing protein n=1 Tax=Paraburkholderia humisilvae TaxID=627669 RepID=A0A6J5CZQ8_9BURK|nr:hypothetical protein [Paraburkholderia humisilvae]CAB3746452.1 hypothetical protein LMG29542_00214 [Paraburkholderia humisilvae]